MSRKPEICSGFFLRNRLMMKEIILEKLAAIEKEHAIRILYACESGSRAWGFHSPDSDYDVRFIYIHEPDHYFGIEDRKDFIQLPVNEELDIVGYDIRKMLKLFRASNAKIFEWIQSPVVYKVEPSFHEGITALIDEYYSPRAGIHHYTGLTRNTLDNDLQSEEVKLKKYFYALRPVLAAKWIAVKMKCPPMEFHSLRAMSEDADVNARIDRLLEKKVQVSEGYRIEKDAVLNEYIRAQMDYCLAVATSLSPRHTDVSHLNLLFKKMVRL